MTQLPGREYWGPIWDAISEQSPPPGTGLVTIVGLFVAAVMLVAPRVFVSRALHNPAMWPKLLITQTHEGAHAFTALLCRHGVTSIRLEKNHSGTTNTLDYGGFGSFLVSYSGYLGPGLAACLLAVLAGSGYAMAAVAVYAVMSLLMLLFMRNLVGLIFVGTVTALTLLTLWSTNTTLATVIALSACWYLALGGVLAAIEQIAVIRSNPDAGADAQQLRAKTGIATNVWSYSQVIASVVLAGAAIALMTTFPVIP